jgi:cell division protein FtsB
MGKIGKRVKKENGNLVVENNVLEEEMMKLKDELENVKRNSSLYFEKVKEMQKQNYELLCENDEQ